MRRCRRSPGGLVTETLAYDGAHDDHRCAPRVDETLRIREYSAGEDMAAFAFDHQRFAAHEEFFVEELHRC